MNRQARHERHVNGREKSISRPFLFFLLSALGVLGGSTCFAAASELTIAQDGKSEYSIIFPRQASPAVKLAANEIQKYVEQMSGVKLLSIFRLQVSA